MSRRERLAALCRNRQEALHQHTRGILSGGFLGHSGWLLQIPTPLSTRYAKGFQAGFKTTSKAMESAAPNKASGSRTVFEQRSDLDVKSGRGSSNRVFIPRPTKREVKVRPGLLSSVDHQYRPSPSQDSTSVKDWWFRDLVAPSPPPFLTSSASEDLSKLYHLLASPLDRARAAELVRLFRGFDDGQVSNIEPSCAWRVFQVLNEYDSLKALRRKDWHRLSSLVLANFPFAQPNDPSVAGKAITLLRSMKDGGFGPDDVIYSHLCLALKDDSSKLKEVHKYMLQTFNSTPQQLGDEEIPVPVVSDQSIRVSLAVYLRRPPGQPVLLSKARELWGVMKRARISPSIETLCGFLEAFKMYRGSVLVDGAGVNKVHQLISVMRPEKRNQPSVYDALISAHAACGNSQAVQSLFTGKERSGFQLTSENYEHYFRALPNSESAQIIQSYRKLLAFPSIAIDDSVFEVVTKAFVTRRDISVLERDVHRLLRKQLLMVDRPQTSNAKTATQPTSKSYASLVEAYSKLKAREQTLLAYRELSLIRKRSALADTSSTPNPPTAGNWKTLASTLPSRSSLCHVVSVLAEPSREAQLREFVKSDVLTSTRLQVYWDRILSGQEISERKAVKHVTAQAVAIKSKRPNPASNASSPAVSSSPTADLNGKVSVGLDGPLRVVYETLIDKWQHWIDEHYDATDKAEQFMHLEDILNEFYSDEDKIVREIVAQRKAVSVA
ncbi:hypothetical protein DFS34DRAFT_683341 [Phlyctochytrium arcticum]|nr:hypothetical protein DFS34DRAFT_683341 [Phlyctochytrium arcticum]